eukprot:COSAG01_NODE_3846_length_5644_cov_48.943192_8_plen_63_part_00
MATDVDGTHVPDSLRARSPSTSSAAVMREVWGCDTFSAPAQASFLLHVGLPGASRAFAIRKL